MTYDKVVETVDKWIELKAKYALDHTHSDTNESDVMGEQIRDILILAITGDADVVVKLMQKEVRDNE